MVKSETGVAYIPKKCAALCLKTKQSGPESRRRYRLGSRKTDPGDGVSSWRVKALDKIPAFAELRESGAGEGTYRKDRSWRPDNRCAQHAVLSTGAKVSDRGFST